MKKLIALLLALVLVLALAACGEKPADTGDDTANTGDDATTGDDASTGGDDAGDDAAAGYDYSKPYTIVWFMGGTQQADGTMVNEALAKYINETYGMNLTLDITQTPFGDLGQKMNAVFTGGEKWDLCYTASWSNDYVGARGNGAYLALDGLLEVLAPNLCAFVNQYWAAVTTDGHIWAVPNIQLEYYWAFVTIPTYWVDMYNEANPDTPLTNDTQNKGTDLNDFAYWCKENVIDAGVAYNGVVPKYFSRGISVAGTGYGMENVANSVYVDSYDPTCTMVDAFSFPDYMDDVNMLNRWYNDGLIQSDILTADFANSDWASLLWMQQSHPTFKPGEDANQAAYWNLPVEDLCFFTFGEPIASTSAVIATLTALNANCEDPGIVLKFLDIINTDAEAFNYLCFGIPGYHYTLADDGTVIPSEENTGYDPNVDWAFGNQFLAHPRAGQSADIWEVTAEMNSQALAAADMGWLADSQNVATQVANVASVNAEYKPWASTAVPGTDEDFDAYTEAYRTALYNAGLQDIIDEYQSQVNAWLEANGK